jgi:hypothetical protein
MYQYPDSQLGVAEDGYELVNFMFSLLFYSNIFWCMVHNNFWHQISSNPQNIVYIKVLHVSDSRQSAVKFVRVNGAYRIKTPIEIPVMVLIRRAWA